MHYFDCNCSVEEVKRAIPLFSVKGSRIGIPVSMQLIQAQTFYALMPTTSLISQKGENYSQNAKAHFHPLFSPLLGEHAGCVCVCVCVCE